MYEHKHTTDCGSSQVNSGKTRDLLFRELCRIVRPRIKYLRKLYQAAVTPHLKAPTEDPAFCATRSRIFAVLADEAEKCLALIDTGKALPPDRKAACLRDEALAWIHLSRDESRRQAQRAAEVRP